LLIPKKKNYSRKLTSIKISYWNYINKETYHVSFKMSAPVNRKVSTAYVSTMYKSKPPPHQDIPEGNFYSVSIYTCILKSKQLR